MLRILELMKEKTTDSLAKLERPLQRQVTLLQAEEVSQQSRELLITQDWCLRWCSTLHDEVIVVVRNEDVQSVPDGYAVCSELELGELCQDDISDATLRPAHEAKKTAGAVVISVEDAKGTVEQNRASSSRQ